MLFAFGILLFVGPAYAGWIATADYSSCPRKYFPQAIATEGPFNLESECLAKIRQVDREQNASCAKYSCATQAGSATASGSGSAAAGHEMDEHIGKAISAGISGDISATDAVGLASLGLLGNALLAPAAPQRVKSPQEYEAERVAAERMAFESARLHREREDKKDASIAPMFALLDPIPTIGAQSAPEKPSEKSNFWSKGFEHASQCVSQNAGSSCAGVTGDQQGACVADYRAGYDAGDKERIFSMEQAYQTGLAAGKRKDLANGGADSRASGPCRTDWIQSYNLGHTKGKTGK